ncbi:hypothetical protein [Streptomyces malaysiensis]|uniref:Uncharacterized protein n=1 Tax=Streptomyces malaysiensis TaxID=92644 RepID=A0A7X5X904_STRMQ|nr:hypothetical protein [Streptomyces malaysiensis]NIY68035.1 hypothetical protein [Streptomyces malaysiensis]
MVSTGKRAVTLGFLGTGDVAPELVCDTLNSHFNFGSMDADGYFGPSAEYDLTVYLPAGETVTSSGTHAACEWAIRCELAYQVLWDQTGNQYTPDLLGSTDQPEDVISVEDVTTAMIERLSAQDNTMLLVLGNGEGQLDDPTAEAAAEALRAEIPVYDLSRALLEVTWCHLPDHEPPQTPAPDSEDDGELALVPADAPDVTLSASEATIVTAAFSKAEQLLDLIGTDVMTRIETVRESLIHGRSLLAPKPETAVEDGDEPKKTKLEIFNPTTGQWEAAGRGRPPKNAQKRRVPA